MTGSSGSLTFGRCGPCGPWTPWGFPTLTPPKQARWLPTGRLRAPSSLCPAGGGRVQRCAAREECFPAVSGHCLPQHRGQRGTQAGPNQTPPRRGQSSHSCSHIGPGCSGPRPV